MGARREINEYLVRHLVSCIFLWMAAVPDLRTHEIPVWIPGVFSAAAVAADLFGRSCLDGWELWAGVLPGAILLMLSLLLKGRLGAGDGICLMVSGLLTGFTSAVMVAQISMMAGALTGCFFLLTKRKRGGDRIAFVPFMAAAGSLLLIVGAVEAL